MRRDLLRPESRGSPPARPGDLVKALGNESGISRSTVSRIRDGHRRGGRRLPEPHPGSHLVPLRLRRRHLPGRESGPEGGLPGAGGGHRRVGRRPPGDPGTWPWGTPRRSTSGSSLSCGPCASAGSRSPPPRPRGRGPGHQRRPRRHPRRRQGDPSRSRLAALPRPASPAPSPPGLGSARPRARGRPGLHDLRPHQSGGRGGPVQARHRRLEGRLPRDRSDADRRRAGPNGLRHDPSAPRSTGPRSGRSNPIERLNREIKRRADVVQVFPDSESARPLIGSVLPEQRGVAVRRTTPPLPDLTAPPDRHAPGRQQRRRRRPPRPAPHHHLTGRTPHQKT